MTIADRIRIRRNELNLSQAELALRAGYSDRTAISKFENAGNDITMKQVKRIAQALNVSSAYLMGWSESPDKEAEDLIKDAYVEQQINSEKIEKAKALYNQYESLSPEKQAQFENFLKFLLSEPDLPHLH